MALPIVVLDGAEVIVVSEGAASLLAIAPEELLGGGLIGALAEKGRQKLVEASAGLKAGGQRSTEVTMRWGPRPARLIRLHLESLASGHVLGHLSDVSEEARLNVLPGLTFLTVFVLDYDLKLRWVTEQSATTLGMAREALTACHLWDFIHPDDRPKVERAVNAVNDSVGQTSEVVARCRTPLVRVYTQCRIFLTYLPGVPAIDGYVLRCQADAGGVEFDEDDGRSAITVSMGEANPVGMVWSSLDGGVYSMSSVAHSMVGRALAGRNIRDIVSTAREEHRGAIEEAMRAIEVGERGQAVGAFEQPDGSVLWLRMTCTPLFGKRNNPEGCLMTLLDVTAETEACEELQRMQLEFQHLAHHDPLTGLPNRALFMDRLGQSWARHERHGDAIALLFCDLDRFKEINDQLGHQSGDLVLQEAASRIRGCVRQTDTVARLGGDEFVVLCEDQSGDLANVEHLVERITEALKQPILLAGGLVTVGVSIGVSATAADVSSPDALIAAADQNMYRLKRDRRDAETSEPRTSDHIDRSSDHPPT